jgi:hypothetical protein
LPVIASEAMSESGALGLPHAGIVESFAGV